MACVRLGVNEAWCKQRNLLVSNESELQHVSATTNLLIHKNTGAIACIIKRKFAAQSKYQNNNEVCTQIEGQTISLICARKQFAAKFKCQHKIKGNEATMCMACTFTVHGMHFHSACLSPEHMFESL